MHVAGPELALNFPPRPMLSVIAVENRIATRSNWVGRVKEGVLEQVKKVGCDCMQAQMGHFKQAPMWGRGNLSGRMVWVCGRCERYT